jgi:hypothetical protein
MFLTDVVNYLIAQGVLTALGQDAFCDYLPDKPDKVSSFQEYQGTGPILGAEGTGRRFQVSVRSSIDDPLWAHAKAWAIYKALIPEDGVIDSREDTPAGNLWGSMIALQTPFKLRVDSNDRVVYGFNASTITSMD